MAPDKKGQNWNRIPIDFLDLDGESGADDTPEEPTVSADELDTFGEGEVELLDAEPPAVAPSPQADGTPGEVAPSAGGP